MSVKVERYAFRLVRQDIAADEDNRASDNLRLFLEWSQTHPNDELSYFGQHVFVDETMDAIRNAIMNEDTPQNALATLSSFSG